jgi:hypothetical protein
MIEIPVSAANIKEHKFGGLDVIAGYGWSNIAVCRLSISASN